MGCNVERGDVNGGYCFINRQTLSEANNLNSIDYKIKGMKMFPMYLKWRILDKRIVLILMLCYLYPYFINIPVWNSIIN